MNARNQAVLYDFFHWTLVAFLIALLPTLEALAASDLTSFDWRKFVAAVIAALVLGVIGAVRKWLAPQLISLNTGLQGEQPTVVGVALKDVNPAPAKLDQIQQAGPTLETLDAAGADKIQR